MFLKRFYLFVLLLALFAIANGQTGSLKGSVKDITTGEPLIGATILIAEGKGVVTDIDGNYKIEATQGKYNIRVSFIGYEPIEKQVTIDKSAVSMNFELTSITMKEVVITTDIARSRETPVAYTNINTQKIEEELAGRDLGIILNDIPGAQGTMQGGGDGDVKVTIRGFSDRNVGFLIDGIPLNDMERGTIYWSDFTGIDLVTRTMQVQRGLGASKLAIPSIGGTINIITKGIETRQSISVAQEVGSYGLSRTSVSYTSGKLKHGWGVTLGGAFKRRDGWANQTNTIGGFYFFKVEKSFHDRHTLTISGNGTPQKHGQRPYAMPIAVYDTAFARAEGVTSDQFATSNNINHFGLNRGVRFNPYWGNLQRYDIVNGDTSHTKTEQLNSQVNNYQQPQVNVKYAFAINPKLFWTTNAYVSVGMGGGTTFAKGINSTNYGTDGQILLQNMYNANRFSPFSIDPYYSTTEKKSGQYIERLNNDHLWYGVLSNINYSISKIFTFSGGIDLRDYKGNHYGQVVDLLGGDYTADGADPNTASTYRKLGDRVKYNYSNRLRWAGSFAQLEVKKGHWTAFVGLTGSYNGYNQVDFYNKKDLVLSDTILKEAVGLKDTIKYNGNAYTNSSKEARYDQTGWKWVPGYTIKAGASYKINEFHSVFVNVGYLSRTPMIRNIIASDVTFVRDVKNELIKSVEAGYSLHYSKLVININGYYTLWDNRPVNNTAKVIVDGITYSANINGMNARHVGGEMEMTWRIIKQLQIDGIASLADWRWTSKDTVTFYDDSNNPIKDDNGNIQKTAFDARNVHVGDAPQSQLGLAIRVEPIKGLYIKVKASYFMKYYSQFDPMSLSGPNAGRESWRVPNYGLFDLFAGYKWKISDKHRLDFNIAVLNILNHRYISDANNNDASVSGTADFDAKSASVFFGMPISFTAGIKYTFY